MLVKASLLMEEERPAKAVLLVSKLEQVTPERADKAAGYMYIHV